MAIDRSKIPVRFELVDNIGVSDEARAMYRKKGMGEFTKLAGMTTRGALAQGVRRFSLGGNVEVEAVICHNIQIVTVTIGAREESITREKECWCCGPCLVAGKIMNIYARYDEAEMMYYYEEDDHYYADILICQSPSSIAPKNITRYDINEAGGGTSIRETPLTSGSYSEEFMMNAIFSDYQNHKVGDNVMVLVQPLCDFVPYYGEFSPCINRRRLANGGFEFSAIDPETDISTQFINSSGLSCQIALDEQVWDELYNDLEEPPEPPADEKYNPFRILPIKIESCLS